MDNRDRLGSTTVGTEHSFATQGKLGYLLTSSTQKAAWNGFARAFDGRGMQSGLWMCSWVVLRTWRVLALRSRRGVRSHELQLDDRAIVDEFFATLDLPVVRDQSIHLGVVLGVVRALSS